MQTRPPARAATADRVERGAALDRLGLVTALVAALCLGAALQARAETAAGDTGAGAAATSGQAADQTTAGKPEGGADAQAADIVTSYGISTFGTLKYPADFKHLAYVNPEAPKGGQISVWAPGSFDSLNPFTFRGTAERYSSLPYESLLTGTADEVGADYCLICKTLTYPKGRSWVIFTLRPEAKFSDGSQVTAEDVKFSYALMRDKGLPDFSHVLNQQVAGAEVLGPEKIRFTFKKGFPTRDLPMVVGTLPIFSKADYEKKNYDLTQTTMTPLIGSGPYMLGSMKVGQTAVYKLNPDYWGKDLPINVGRNNFGSIRVEYYADYNAAFEGFKGGSYTFRDEASSILWATGYNFPTVKSGAVKKVEIPKKSIAVAQAFVFNLRRAKFQDPRVREAIGLMFNFQWSNQKLFYGLYARVNSFWQNSQLAASGKPSPDELKLLEPLKDELPPGTLTEDAVNPPSSGERQMDRGNARKASRLLDEAGWTVGKDGKRRNAKGEPLRVEFLNDSQSFDRIITPFVENLKAIGVDAYLTDVDDAQYTTRTRNPSYDFDIITAQFPMSYLPGAGDLKQYFGSETADISTFNVMGLKDKAVDALIDDVAAAKSQPALETAVHALDRVLRAKRFWIPEWWPDTYRVAYYDMFEHPDVLPPYALGQLDFWWYDKKKAEALRAAGVLR